MTIEQINEHCKEMEKMRREKEKVKADRDYLTSVREKLLKKWGQL